ncbi:MAG: hypothetical protein ABIS68_10705, partial [Casimicrobiaceae bacterium]
RDRQTEWMARLIADEQQRTQLPVWLLGTAFKANVSVEEGSPALLLLGALHKLGLEPQLHDPLVPARWNPPPATSALFVIGAPHNAFREFAPAAGSVIVDPWHHVVPSKGVRILAVGRATAPAL